MAGGTRLLPVEGGRGEGGAKALAIQVMFSSVPVLTCTTVWTSARLTVMTQKKVQIRASSDEVELWKEAAHIRRSTLSAWMRRVLTATATSIKEKSSE